MHQPLVVSLLLVGLELIIKIPISIHPIHYTSKKMHPKPPKTTPPPNLKNTPPKPRHPSPSHPAPLTLKSWTSFRDSSVWPPQQKAPPFRCGWLMEVDGNQKSGRFSDYLQRFEHHPRWLALGFLNHQQYYTPKTYVASRHRKQESFHQESGSCLSFHLSQVFLFLWCLLNTC